MSPVTGVTVLPYSVVSVIFELPRTQPQNAGDLLTPDHKIVLFN